MGNDPFDDAATTMAMILQDHGHDDDSRVVLSLVNHAEGDAGVCVAANALAEYDLLHLAPTPSLQIAPYVTKDFGYDRADSSVRAELRRRGAKVEADEVKTDLD